MERVIFCLDITKTNIIGLLANVDRVGSITVLAIQERSFDKSINYFDDQKKISSTISDIKNKIEEEFEQKIENVFVSVPSTSTIPSVCSKRTDFGKATMITKTIITDEISKIVERKKDEKEIPACFLPVSFTLDDEQMPNPIGKIGTFLESKILEISVNKRQIFSLIKAIEDANLNVVDVVVDVVSESFAVASEQFSKKTQLILSMNDEIKVIETTHGIPKRTMWSDINFDNILYDVARKFNISNTVAQKLIFRVVDLATEAPKVEDYFYTNAQGEQAKINTEEVMQYVLKLFESEIIRLKNEMNRFFAGIDHMIITGKWAMVDGIDKLMSKIIGKQVNIYQPSEIEIQEPKYVRIKGTCLFSLITEEYFKEHREIVAYNTQTKSVNNISDKQEIPTQVRKEKSIFTKLAGAIMHDDKKE